MKSKLLLFVLFGLPAFLGNTVGAQTYETPKIEDLIKTPPSPEAQAFAKYGNAPANLYTGTPSISIPIGNLKGREIDVPITLAYDASGIKVEQLATWVGLGWNLNVGGMVTRQVIGLPDDAFTATPTYYPFYHPLVKSDYEFARDFTAVENSAYQPGLLGRYFDFLYQATRTDNNVRYELQPDTYSFHAPGLSGTLFIDYDLSVAYCIESPEIKATPLFNPNTGTKVITGWIIKDGNGSTYYFELAERTYAYDNDPLDGQRVYNSAWVLTKIESKNKRDVVLFNYTALPKWEQLQLAGRGISYNDFPHNPLQGWASCGADVEILSVQPTYQIEQQELTSIIVNGKTLATFQAPTTRQDLSGKHKLDEIILYDQNNTRTQRYQLVHSYFGAPAADEKQLRLRLDGINIYGVNDIDPPQKYMFSYFDGLPSRESMAQDYWGYYNGADNNMTLVPFNYEFDRHNIFFEGGNRRPNAAYVRSGTLNEIQYPTGGKTRFSFSANQSSEISHTYVEEYLAGATGITGGTNSADPFGYLPCDDRTTLPPKGIEQAFQVTEAGLFDFKLNISNTNPSGNPTNHMHFVALYYAGSTGHQPRSFCDLLNNGNTVFFLYDGFSSGFSTTQEVSLIPGYYRIMILNTMPTTTINVEVIGRRTISKYDAGGIRLSKVEDFDNMNTLVTSKLYYYGDISKQPSSIITESHITSHLGGGTLHAVLAFEEGKFFEMVPSNGTGLDVMQCGSLYRYGSNRTQFNHIVTYPVVSEISFDGSGNHTGYTVTWHKDNLDNYIGGFSKRFVNNGKVVSRRIYSRTGDMISHEKNYYSQSTVVPGTIGFYFQAGVSTLKNIYVVRNYGNSNDEYFMSRYSAWTGSPAPEGGINWSPQHCNWNGITGILFDHTGIHRDGNDNHGILSDDCDNDFNPSHPAMVYKQQLVAEGIPDVSIDHYRSSSRVQVSRRTHYIILCRNLGSDYQKMQYLYSRWWPRLDSTVMVQYSGQDSLITWTRNLFENTNHYQITRVRQGDSRGTVHTTRFYYPHDMYVLEPSNTIWTTLANDNRIAEKIRVESTFGNNQKDFLRHEAYRTHSATSGTMVLVDRIQLSSGNGPLEDRIRFHQYDDVGNPIEVSRESDMRIALQWGYNQQLLVAEIKNAQQSKFFYTSFEEGDGNSANGDSRTGLKSKTGGYSYTVNGLTSGKNYVLTYWQKSGSVWGLQTITINNLSGTSYTISLTGQVDEVRLYPQGALMTTYSYKPGVGVIHIADVNNQISTYEYDTFNRPHVIKDDAGKIVKQFKYNYFQTTP